MSAAAVAAAAPLTAAAVYAALTYQSIGSVKVTGSDKETVKTVSITVPAAVDYWICVIVGVAIVVLVMKAIAVLREKIKTRPEQERNPRQQEHASEETEIEDRQLWASAAAVTMPAAAVPAAPLTCRVVHRVTGRDKETVKTVSITVSAAMVSWICVTVGVAFIGLAVMKSVPVLRRLKDVPLKKD